MTCIISGMVALRKRTGRRKVFGRKKEGYFLWIGGILSRGAWKAKGIYLNWAGWCFGIVVALCRE